jgi:hypothetical protein
MRNGIVGKNATRLVACLALHHATTFRSDTNLEIGLVLDLADDRSGRRP